MPSRKKSDVVAVIPGPTAAEPAKPKRVRKPKVVAASTPPVNKLRNYLVIALDASGSMGSIYNETIQMFNSVLGSARQKSEELNQETLVSLVIFSDTANVAFPPTPIAQVKPLDSKTYQLRGLTALLDGTGLAIETLEKYTSPEAGIDKSFLVITITDGGENNSYRYNAAKLKNTLKQYDNREDWTVAFQLPPGAAKTFCAQFGIPIENTREWENTRVGVQETQVQTSAAIGSYLTARSTGVKKSLNFFKMTTDLSSIDTKKIKKNLDDLSGNFKSYTVDKEVDVSSFVEVKTGKPYVAGSAFYQLMKKEKIQPDKQVLITEKGKKQVWGGTEARKLIGLPDSQEARVEPGNHSNYEIFVQSKSTNRKLPRGTKILVDKTLAGV